MGKEKDGLSTPVSELKGAGAKTAMHLEKKGIKTIEDLFWFLPVRYAVKSSIKQICELVEGENASIVAKVVASRSMFFRHSRKKAYEAIVEDPTGSISVKWFQWVREYLNKVCRKGNLLMLSGSVTRFGEKMQMVHPEIQILEDESEAEGCKTTAPVYSETEGLKQGTIRILMKRAFEAYGHHIKSVIPEGDERTYGLDSLYKAFFNIHFPVDGSGEGTDTDDRHMKRHLRRLILEEYFLFQSALLIKKEGLKRDKGICFNAGGAYYTGFYAGLPFELTGAQKRVIREIESDMSQKVPMNRLLQGDVGSGKTVCAVIAALIAVDSGYQAALMAPTEILAEQHYLTMHKYFDHMGVPVAFLRGNMGRDRSNTLEQIKNGNIKVVIGTHAIIQSDVVFNRLGLAIIDEQHRFGVMQRKMLRQKAEGREQKTEGRGKRGDGRGKQKTEIREQATGEKGDSRTEIENGKGESGTVPDVLVMTATPIPRTLSMVIYGDLDVSIIDEMPEGRQRIHTKVFHEKDRHKAFGIVEGELKKGRQAYIVYPLVEESEKLDYLNATEMSLHLQASVFPSYRVGLLHGKMKPEEKEGVMAGFKNREIDVLVCTTVIEVGIDVPNATVIVIENAERFGLSQLHQLRGRVGRGKYQSKCILITSAKRTALASKRLRAIEETADGFKISEEDMRLRGPGEMLGVKQSGIPDFRAGDVVDDVDIMIEARKIAATAIPDMTADDIKRIQERAGARWNDVSCLVDIA